MAEELASREGSVPESEKARAPRNRSVTLTDEEREALRPRLKRFETRRVSVPEIENAIINQDFFEVLDSLPDSFVDLLFADPPYNIQKRFGARSFPAMKEGEYAEWLASWFPRCVRLLKPGASVYLCGDWRGSSALRAALDEALVTRSRITWEREKGRGAARNWKSASEDIWFATLGDEYYFDSEAVRLRRAVLAPYRDSSGAPKDWVDGPGGAFRDTLPSNLWTDISVPYWSMSENTEHPTQKPEKLLAKVLLASCPPGGMVFDPFAGSGTTAVVAKKLGRRFCAVEIDEEYCLLAQKRLDLADEDSRIQGYEDGVFWERNAKKPKASRGQIEKKRLE